MEATELYKATFKFNQEPNCISDEDDWEELEIECVSDLGIDASDGKFFMVIRTSKWSIDSVADLEKLVKRIKKVILKQNKNGK